MQTFIYFAYGSNMASRRLLARTPSARVISAGYLLGHHLAWHKRGSDGSGKCDIVETGVDADRVWGVLFEIDCAEQVLLDQAEGLGHGYDYKRVEIRVGSAIVVAGAYHATDLDAGLPPFDWYLALVVAGAEEHGLPPAYCRDLRAIAAVVDPHAERRRSNLALLSEAPKADDALTR